MKKKFNKNSQVGSDEGGGNTLKVLDPASVLNVSAYYYICVLILFRMRLHYFMCPHTTISVSRRHITQYACSYYYICVFILLYVSAYYYICVLMCPHASIQPASYSICVLITLCVLILLCMCPHATIRVIICVLILLYMCHHATGAVSRRQALAQRPVGTRRCV